MYQAKAMGANECIGINEESFKKAVKNCKSMKNLTIYL